MSKVFRTWTIDYAGKQLNVKETDMLHDKVVKLFESFGLKVDGCSDGPTEEIHD